MDSPLPEHEIKHRGQVEAQPVRMVELKFPVRAEALHPTQERFVYWSPAALFLWGGLEISMLSELDRACGEEVTHYHHRFGAPIFRGLEAGSNHDWNHVLWAVERHLWEPMVDYLCSTMLTSQQQKLVIKYALQSFQVVDPLVMSKPVVPSRLPLMEVHLFGVKTNLWTAAVDIEKLNPPVELPALRFFEEDEACKMYADRLYNHKAQLDLG